MANLNTTGNLTSAMTEFYSKIILRRALPELAHDRYGQQRPLPRRSSTTIKFSRYGLFTGSGTAPTGALADITVNTTALTEGAAPSGKFFNRASVTTSLNQYGDFVEISDMIDLTNPDPVLVEANQALGEQAGRSLDIVHRDSLVSGTNFIYANAVAGKSSVVSVPLTSDFDRVIRTLQGQAASMFTEIIRATTGIGTAPIRSAYWSIIHPDVWYTTDNLPLFISVEKYSSLGPVQPGEVGAYKNIRFVLTTQARVDTGAGGSSTSVKNTAGSADVYTTFVFGRDAYGIVPLEGHALRNITHPIGSSGVFDPLNQVATTGWKAITAPALVLNNNWMVQYLSAAAL